MSRVTSIFFDLDGTLYCSPGLAAEIDRLAVEGLALQLGMAPAEVGPLLAATKAALGATAGGEATLSAACRELGCDLGQLHEFLAGNVAPEKFLQINAGVVAMLQRLQRHYRLYIYTNNNLALTTRILRAIGLDGLFVAVYSIESFWRAKPDSTALAMLFTATGVEPEECLFVGDRYSVDLRLPEEHGCRVFLTTNVAGLLSLEEFCSTI